MAPQRNRQNVLMNDQHRLSEQLQLLSHFKYSDLDMPYAGVGEHSNKATRNPDTNTMIRILDTIAVALTTGLAGDIYAAAFDTSRGLKLVLAKNVPPSANDDGAVRALFSQITAPQAPAVGDLLPFLFTRCGANIRKRVAKMGDTLNNFSSGIEEALKEYESVPSIDEEFPSSTDYRDLLYGDGAVTFAEMIRDLLKAIKDTVTRFDSQDLYTTSGVHRFFSTFVLMVIVLKKSRLLRWLCQSDEVIYRHRKLQAEQLKRRLAKVSQYSEGIADVITYTRRYFPQGIAYCWVDPIHGTGETTVKLVGGYAMAIERALGVPPMRDTLATLHDSFPEIRVEWGTSRSITTRLHAEIHILLHLSKSFDDNLDNSQQRPIGCSKRSCLCCTLWIWAYNKRYGTNWLTSGSHGKPYSAWALPGCTYAHAWVKGGQSEVDVTVMDGVQERLTQTITKLFPNQRRPSDEHRSSGSELGGSDSEEERTTHRRDLVRDVRQEWDEFSRTFGITRRL